jgi:hypothetical protein
MKRLFEPKNIERRCLRLLSRKKKKILKCFSFISSSSLDGLTLFSKRSKKRERERERERREEKRKRKRQKREERKKREEREKREERGKRKEREGEEKITSFSLLIS